MSFTTNEYLTVAEAAELLRVSVSTIRRWIRAGSMTAHRAGHRRLLLKRADVTRAVRDVGVTTNGATHTPAEASVLAEQPKAHSNVSGIMTPETWEDIREGRELRSEQIMNELEPEFDAFDLGVVAHMIVHSPDRPRRRLLALDEQRQLLVALERADRTRERIRQRSGVDTFPASEDIIAEMREERSRQLLGEDDSDGEHAT